MVSGNAKTTCKILIPTITDFLPLHLAKGREGSFGLKAIAEIVRFAFRFT